MARRGTGPVGPRGRGLWGFGAYFLTLKDSRALFLFRYLTLREIWFGLGWFGWAVDPALG